MASPTRSKTALHAFYVYVFSLYCFFGLQCSCRLFLRARGQTGNLAVHAMIMIKHVWTNGRQRLATPLAHVHQHQTGST